MEKLTSNQKKLLYGIVLAALAIKLFFPGLIVNLETQSVFTAGSFGISLGILAIIIGIILIIVPEPTTTFAGIIITVAGVILSFGSLTAIINDIFGASGGFFPIALIIFMGYLFFKKVF